MRYWVGRVIKPYCQDFGYKSLCEIGSSTGGSTDMLVEASGLHLTVIDPCLDADLSAKYSNDKRVTVHKGLSLEIVPRLSEKFDCILIDGDHNWYTVFNELRAIEERQLLTNGGTIFFHDVGWPYGRRDMYYQPETIPKEFRHPYAKKGIIYGRSELSSPEGENSGLFNAEEEGGEKNGVLTAIEDFLIERGNEYLLLRFTAEYGLGVLVKKHGIKSRKTLAKWRWLCLVHNMNDAIRRRFPRVYRVVKGIAKRAN